MKKVIIYILLSGISFSGFTKNLDTLVSKSALQVKTVDLQPTSANFLNTTVESAKKAAILTSKITLIA